MRKKKIIPWLFVFFSLIIAPLSYSQNTQANIEEFKKTAPKVYIDCDYCDIEYIKTEIAFVNYVRDRKEAQVHILITIQGTGSGGVEYTLTFMGQLDYAGQDDVLKYYSNKTDTEDEIRKGLVETLKIGLMRYVAKTPISKRISIKLMDEVKPTSVIDKWNFWVFSMNGSGYFNGEKSIKYNSIYGNFSVNRVTPDVKIRMSISARRFENKYDIEGGTIESISNIKYFSGLIVKSLGEHWSIGTYLSLLSSTYSNIQFALNLAPAIEYDLFPYSQSTRKQLRFLYLIGFSGVKYREETIYFKTKENLWSEDLSVTLELKEKWGTISTSLEAANYFHDFSKYHISLNGELAIRLFKGLSFTLYGSGSRIHDQLSLSLKGASLEDILLMRTQLETSYSYYFSVGLRYTFGSIYSNVVNPRFGSGISFGMY